MYKLFFTILIFVAIIPVSAQTNLTVLQEKIIHIFSDSVNNGKNINLFWESFYKLKDFEFEQSKIQGEAKFGFVGNSTEGTEIFKINSGITIKQGVYPYEFEFSTLLNIQYDNGKLKENLSNLRITYDRFFPTEKNKMLYEGYAFINRRSDQYLSVNQRYEIGCGIILAYWSTNLFKDFQQKIDNLNESRISFFPVNENIVFYKNKSKETILAIGITAKDSIDLTTALTNIEQTINKRFSPLRIGILFGVFYELENIVFSYSDETVTPQITAQVDFGTSSKYRWEFRPTLDLFIKEKLRLKIRPYFKMPMPWEWWKIVENKKKTDYRIDFPTILQFKIAENFDLLFEYSYCYDNAPNSIEKPIKEFGFLTANETHQYVNFQVVYNF